MPPLAIGGMFVRPTNTQPASRNAEMENASRVATSRSNAGEPFATVIPFTMYESFAVNGIPSSGPRLWPAARRRSDSCASLNACGFTSTTELRRMPPRSYASIRRKYACTNATLVVSPLSNAVRSSAIVFSTTGYVPAAFVVVISCAPTSATASRADGANDDFFQQLRVNFPVGW